MSNITELRRAYHCNLARQIVRWTKRGSHSYPNFADGSSKSSVAIAVQLCDLLGFSFDDEAIEGQKAGRLFEQITCEFTQRAFDLLQHLRPGHWVYRAGESALSDYVQFRHLARVKSAVEKDPELRSLIGLDYIITPDIVIGRWPVKDDEINMTATIVSTRELDGAGLTPFREPNQGELVLPFLHATISCKWTIRSDRSQNIRTEALNLIRNRKGHLPHIVAVTAEPLPTRLASLALGTGELDCVYHISLPELQKACEIADLPDQGEVLENLIQTQRLRDISDLPFDLAM